MNNDILKKIDKRLFNSIFRQFDKNRKDKTFVYHYTSYGSIQKIVEDNSLRFSNLNKQADKKELIFGLEVLQSLCERSGEYKPLVDLIETKKSGASLAGIKMQFFIFCTNEKKDVYRQWLRYGDKGRGVCIKIDRKKLFNKLSNKKDALCYIYPVLYYVSINDDYSLINPRIKRFENDMLAYFYTLNKDIESAGNDDALKDEIFQVILVFASLIKDAAYRGENEWRFLALQEKNSDEYFLCDNIFDCIEAIILGPGLSKIESANIKAFFEDPNPDVNIDIYKSEQSYLFDN
ncbi:hypothetical protein FACS189468_4460 [Spirochaetia bacterium]|nr:hypothetical protein FACS189468_4460 [Spirochaetia bacterium]